MNRPSIYQVLMDNAQSWSRRGTCSLRQVGAVIADHTGRVVSSGYNGAPAGMDHCDHPCNCESVALQLRQGSHWPGCPANRRCDQAVHAEENAILYAARASVGTYGKMLVTTSRPCYRCARMILTVGIDMVVYRDAESDMAGVNLLYERGVTTLQLKDTL